MASFKQWFVTDADSIDDTLFPGKLKIEYEQSSGDFVALAPKTYMCSDGGVDTEGRAGAIKKGQKGIPRHEVVEMRMFLASLYENTKFSSECQSLQLKVKFYNQTKFKKGFRREK